jgi:hypothetical protein
LSGSGQIWVRVQIGRVGLIWLSERNRIESESGRVNLHIISFFFRFMIDFNDLKAIWSRIGSGQVEFGLDQFKFKKKIDQIRYKFGRIRRVSQIGSSSATLLKIELMLFNVMKNKFLELMLLSVMKNKFLSSISLTGHLGFYLVLPPGHPGFYLVLPCTSSVCTVLVPHGF